MAPTPSTAGPGNVFRTGRLQRQPTLTKLTSSAGRRARPSGRILKGRLAGGTRTCGRPSRRSSEVPASCSGRCCSTTCGPRAKPPSCRNTRSMSSQPERRHAALPANDRRRLRQGGEGKRRKGCRIRWSEGAKYGVDRGKPDRTRNDKRGGNPSFRGLPSRLGQSWPAPSDSRLHPAGVERHSASATVINGLRRTASCEWCKIRCSWGSSR